MRRIDIPGAPVKIDDEEERFLFEPLPLPRHIEIASGFLDLAINGEIERALFYWPPGTAKSTTISQCLPAYAMGKFENNRALCTSFGSKLAWAHSRRARNICKSPAYQRIFNTTLDPATRAVDEWALLNGSEMVAAAIDRVVGRRGRLAIFDDPFKNRKMAGSAIQRQRVKEAIQDDLDSRVVPGGCLLGMFTRYVFDDPAAWLLGEDYKGESGFMTGTDGRRWFVMNCPAEAERDDDPLGRALGEYIWPERLKSSFWQPFKRVERT